MDPKETKKLLFGIVCVCLAICTMIALASVWFRVDFDLGRIFATAVIVAFSAVLFGCATLLLPQEKKPDGEKP